MSSSKASNSKYPEFAHGLGVTFDYQNYFKKKRDKHASIKLNSTLEFSAKLEKYAIQMTKENTKINRLLRSRHLNQAPKCSICELFLLENPTTAYFHIWSANTKDAMSMSWNQVPRNVAKEVEDGQYWSGPVNLCKSCMHTVKWAQERIEWHRIKFNIAQGKSEMLPPICNIYYRLQTAMRLVQFCTIEHNLAIQHENANASRMLQLESNLQVHRDSVERIDQQKFYT